MSNETTPEACPCARGMLCTNACLRTVNAELSRMVIGETEHGDIVYAAPSADEVNRRMAERARSDRSAPGSCASCARPCHYRLFVDDDAIPWCCGRFACECRLRGAPEPSAAHMAATTARDAEFRRLQAIALAAAGVSDEFADDITERDAPLAYAALKALREALDVAPGVATVEVVSPHVPNMTHESEDPR
jgi:hypothetical protein